MIALKYKETWANWSEHELADSAHIVELFAARGYAISLRDAWEAWSDYSAEQCAGWIMLHENDEAIFNTLFFRFEPECKSDLE